MLKRMSVVICGLAIIGMTAGYASAQTATEKTKAAVKNAGDATADAAITTAVKTKLLADTKVGGLKIDVDTKDNVVTLTGPVHSVAERNEAVRLARTTTGVKRVVSKLVVEKTVATTGRTDRVKTEIKDDSKAVAEKTEQVAKKVGNATEKAAKDTGANITDAAITSAVKTKFLADTKVGGLMINVDTNHHVVTLTGTVRSAAERDEAMRLAKTTKGVDKVVDKLVIQP